MNKITKVIVTSCLLTSVALAEDGISINGIFPYLRVDSGLSHFHRVGGIDSQITNKLKSKNTNVAGAGLGVGLSFGDNIRSDISWSHHLQPELNYEASNIIVKRKPAIDAYFLNFYYETNVRLSVFNPYLGVGLGLVSISDRISSVKMDYPSKSDYYKSKKKNNFTYKLMVGSAFDLNETIKFDLSYNYHDYGKTKKLTYNNDGEIGGAHYRSHIISAGLRFGM